MADSGFFYTTRSKTYYFKASSWQPFYRICRISENFSCDTFTNVDIQVLVERALTNEMGKNVGKKIANLNKIPHPKGRKVAQLSKRTVRSAGRAKVKLLHQMKLNLLGEKILWFKENLGPVEKYTPELTLDLIERYLSRFDEELKQIHLKHTTGNRKSRQHANREDIINMTMKNERSEFLTSGIEMPDLLNLKQLNLLRNWSGELRYLQNFALVRYTKRRLENMKPSLNNLEEERKPEKEVNIDSNSSGVEKQQKVAYVMDVGS